MSVSQRPASRFFAAFYRWSSQTQRTRQCIAPLQVRQDKSHRPANSSVRKYHATRTLHEHSQSELQLQNEDSPPSPNHGTSATEGAKRKQTPTSNLPQPGPKDPGTETSNLKDSVRHLLRKVPSSVAVITVSSIDPTTQRPVPMGVAVSSLSSVTLDPPTLSFNIKQPSQTLDAIRAAAGAFRVHFLEADRAGAKIVELFCRGNHAEAYVQRLENLDIRVPSSKEEGQEVVAASLAPQIQDAAVRAALECTVTHEFAVADHVILAARVDSLEQKVASRPTMVYVDGKYMRSDTTITVHGGEEADVERGDK
ncbi:hypothetical protein IQ07DRAFT_634992 [Pyrenochaeta sp. DS3sAY3a]|nr:hypothetical protein IQ07DRAFT_634992 [Pyrenochaeta sp. DS3sAY3a]